MPEISNDLLMQLREEESAKVALARNAATQVGIEAASLNREKIQHTSTAVSHRLDDWKATSQKKSGRCWLFSSLNFLRSRARESLGVKNFEFSQSYVFFWDKFERANWFLTDIIATSDEPVDSRLVQFLLGDVLGDGGQWDMAVSVYMKYGLVPKEVMPESEASTNSRPMNARLRAVLHIGALRLREAIAAGASAEEVDTQRRKILADVWKILVVCLGEPPVRFNWQWRDDEGNFHRDGEVTPHAFYERHVGVDLSEYICLVDDPRPENPKGSMETVEHLGNVVGGRPIRYLNAPVEEIKRIAAAQIAAGEAVWFGADVSQPYDRGLGFFVTGIHDYDGLFDVDFSSTKLERVRSGESAMDHAMLFTGVDLDKAGQPRAWRVENSWGDEPGDSGFFTMDDQWFTDNVFEVVVPKSALPEDLAAAVDSEPIVLPAWDPMGTLA
ncbi:MAG: C1 family peptidase [Actinomyces sp. oral taxon 181]|uniref:aminopeptidase C n=1 Tax=Actinomyces sp. oral taxon 181 TaxID=712121 RepID=UPI0025C369B3|nr:C1 family peptidase [Actinomyces sp. oral taxon 181]MBS4796562.1 C1 family peptidase [Actinomyces sp. oral taxon 181]